MRDDTKKNIKNGLIIGLFFIIISFSYFKTKDLFMGVNLKVNGISDGEASSPLIKINGQAKNATLLSINDRPIFIEPNGQYEESLLLLPGYNIITIKAQDKFNNKTEKVYQLTL